MKNYVIIGVIVLLVIVAFLYMNNQNNKNQEILASQIIKNNSVQQESTKNSLTDFAAVIIPSLLDKFKSMKDEKRQEKEDEEKLKESTFISPNNPAAFTGPWKPTI